MNILKKILKGEYSLAILFWRIWFSTIASTGAIWYLFIHGNQSSYLSVLPFAIAVYVIELTVSALVLMGIYSRLMKQTTIGGLAALLVVSIIAIGDIYTCMLILEPITPSFHH